jgi:TldD protein
MTDALALARRRLLDEAGLEEQHLSRIMGTLLSRQVDIADIYLGYSRSESWVLDDGIIREGDYSIEQGAGIRAVSGEKTGFAYTEQLTQAAMLDAAKAARSIVHSGVSARHAASVEPPTHPQRYILDNPLDSLPENQKIALLHTLDRAARDADPRVRQVNVSLMAAHDTVLIYDELGRITGDVRPLVRLDVSVIVEHHGRREQGYSGGGARSTLDFFLEQDRALGYAREAVRQALVNLEAVEAPAGMMPVVLGPGWPGVLLHEAVGHGLEGDFNRKGTSTFSQRLGEQVASPLCTVVDDGSLPGRRGSLSVDDEGTPSQHTVLIENGILKGYMQDRMNARLMDAAVTGNGRRESYAHLPMPRMTNTYMLSGEQVPQDIIASVDKGLYAVNFGGGQVDITSGKFVFSANEAYLIEKGELGAPVKGATLIGNGPEVMRQISMVGNDLQLDSGVGVCGKEGQSAPVGVGQPTLKIDQLTVGGTHA